MVDLVVLQSVSYIAGATGVAIAAIFYVLNLRETRRNGRLTLANNLMKKLETTEYHAIMRDLLSYEWSNYDEFEKKYGTDYNLDSYPKRLSLWRFYNSLGYMLMKKMVDADSIFNMGDGDGIILVWAKFESIIKTQRKLYKMGEKWMWGFEYLAGEMLKIGKMQGASYTFDTFQKYVPDR
jgi:hypothetical protein